MPLIDALLPEFDHEMTTTRKLLERLPEDKFEWKPHARSTALGGLATHVANLPTWGRMALEQSEFDLGGGGQLPAATSRSELLATFDKNIAAARASLVGRTDAELMAPWTLRRGGQTIFTMPKTVVWRSFVLNHLVHHRGQLSVYLRMLDVKIPSIYGPSADEASF
jgi:uncharacterized damage-inducible protein DinB